MKKLTKRQHQVLDFICQRLLARKPPPSVRELMADMDITSTNGIRIHLKALENKGYIERIPYVARSIYVLHPPPGQEPLSNTERIGLETENIKLRARVKDLEEEVQQLQQHGGIE